LIEILKFRLKYWKNS